MLCKTDDSNMTNLFVCETCHCTSDVCVCVRDDVEIKLNKMVSNNNNKLLMNV